MAPLLTLIQEQGSLHGHSGNSTLLSMLIQDEVHGHQA
jgi:hypothetical protein